MPDTFCLDKITRLGYYWSLGSNNRTLTPIHDPPPTATKIGWSLIMTGIEFQYFLQLENPISWAKNIARSYEAILS